MALSHGLASVRYIDADGIPASTPFNFVADNTATIGDALAACATLRDKVKDITDDAILGIECVFQFPLTEAIVSGAETPEGVNIAMETSAPSRDWTLWIPSLKDSLVVSGKVNIATGAIPALAAELVTPSGALTWETPYLNAFSALESAAKSPHKLRNLASKKSKSENPV